MSNEDRFMDASVSGLVYSYLKSTPGIPKSLVESFKGQFRPPVLSQSSPTIEEMYAYFQKDERALNGLVYSYLKSTPEVPQSLVESFKKQFHPPILPLGSPTLEGIYLYFQKRLAGVVYSYLESNPEIPASFVESFKKQCHPPIPPQGFPTLEEMYLYFEKNAPAKRRLILNPIRRLKQPISPTQCTTSTDKLTAEATLAFRAWSKWDHFVAQNNPKFCVVCDKSCRTPSTLRVHLYSHMNPEEKKIVKSGWEFICYFCSRRFPWLSELSKHIANHTGERPFKCQRAGCLKTFARSDNLAAHNRTHSKLAEIRRPFKCPCCGACFAKKEHLDRHLKIHAGLRDHECDLCEKKFVNKDRLKRHVEAVHKKIRHGCRYCPKTYTEKHTARAHEKAAHGLEG